MATPALLLLRFKPEGERCVLCPTDGGINLSQRKMYTFLASRGMFYQKHLIDEVSVAVNPWIGSSAHVVKCNKERGKDRYLYYMLRLLKENPSSNFAPDKVLLNVGGGAAAVKYVRKNVASFGNSERADPSLRVSEIGLYALTSADDRMGMSARFLALQTALLKYFVHALAKRLGIGGAEALAKLLDPYDSYPNCSSCEPSEWEGVRFGDAVASIVSSLRWLFTLEKNYESVAGLGTSAVWLVEKQDVGGLIECITSLASSVRESLSCRKWWEPGYGVEFWMSCSQSDYELRFLMDGKEIHALSNKHCSKVLNIFLGRAVGLIKNLTGASETYREGMNNKKLLLAIEWSEQSGPIDIALILTWLQGKLRYSSLDKVVILTTPLAYAHAVAAGLYLKKVLGKLGKLEMNGSHAIPLKIGDTSRVKTSILMTSGSDPVYIAALIKRLAKEVAGDDEHMLYFLGGSTLHSMMSSYILRKELGDRVTVLAR